MSINDINPSENQIECQNKVFEEHKEKEKSNLDEKIPLDSKKAKL